MTPVPLTGARHAQLQRYRWLTIVLLAASAILKSFDLLRGAFTPTELDRVLGVEAAAVVRIAVVAELLTVLVRIVGGNSGVFIRFCKVLFGAFLA